MWENYAGSGGNGGAWSGWEVATGVSTFVGLFSNLATTMAIPNHIQQPCHVLTRKLKILSGS